MSIKGFKLTDNSVEQYDYNYLDNAPQLDTSLSISGAIAESKTVGTNINNLNDVVNNIIDGQQTISVEPADGGLYVNFSNGDIKSGSNFRVPKGEGTGVKIKIPKGCIKIFFDNWNITPNITTIGGWATYSTNSGTSISAFVRGGNTPYIDVQPGDIYFSTTLYSPPSNPVTEFIITYVYANSELVSTVRELNDGGLQLKDDTIKAQINDWLDNNPDATTTVEDASITPSKLAQSTLDYFSSRAYYNVRDYGINPDTGSDIYNKLFTLVKTIESEETGGTVFFPRGEYILSDCIFIPSNTIFMGEGPATHIIFNETYTSMGTGLSNGGDNCGVMNMTIDCANSNPIQSGSMTGGIGFSTFDGTTITTPHQNATSISRRNTKNVFAHNIWTNTRYILQTETGEN